VNDKNCDKRNDKNCDKNCVIQSEKKGIESHRFLDPRKACLQLTGPVIAFHCMDLIEEIHWWQVFQAFCFEAAVATFDSVVGEFPQWFLPQLDRLHEVDFLHAAVQFVLEKFLVATVSMLSY